MSLLSVGEFHAFEASGRRFAYMVPSAAVFAFDDCADAVVALLREAPQPLEGIVARLAGRFDADEVGETLAELRRVRAVVTRDVVGRDFSPAQAGGAEAPPYAHAGGAEAPPYAHAGGAEAPPDAHAGGAEAPPDEKGSGRRILPLTPVPLQTLVVNVTNQCNLSCEYCYEYGEDKIVDTENGSQPKFMSEETARAAVDFALRESGANRAAHITFFGGETLMNFPVLTKAVAYARARARELGKDVDFSLTTNATLLRPDVIDFLADERIGVTISIDGPQEIQDKFRVFNNGQGSYAMAAPRIKALLARHRTRPIGARVTLTRQTLDVMRIYKHLHDEMGFWEVGFAPVTTAPQRGHAISDGGFDHLLAQFRELAADFLQASLENRHHGFSNVRETLQELHQGHAKAYPCGAGIGLMGVATDGEVALCHRFAGSEAHRFGSVGGGVDRGKQAAFLEAHHIDHKTDCQSCWARPICAGGCYHEAHTRYGTTTGPNLHYCEWIRGWTHTCLEIYGELAVKNPAFLRQFDGADDEAPQRH